MPMTTTPLGDWIMEGLCAQVDPELHFSELGSTYHAARVCNACRVRTTCLDWALEQDEPPAGVWGGHGERTRRRMKARMQANA